MIAALPMYDRPETAAANDRLWALIRDALGHGPARLTRGADPWQIWQSPDLLLAQTCGMPYRTRLHDRVTLVGTPDYGVEGCAPGHYRSVLVARPGDAGRPLADFTARRLAFNDALSQSGWAAPQAHAAAHGLRFTDLLRTGAHAESVRAVAAGHADIAAIDAVTWAILGDDARGGLIVIGRTDPTPGLPLIAARGTDPEPVLGAVRAAIAALSPGDRAVLRIRGITRIPAAAYLAVATPPGPGQPGDRLQES